MEVAKLVPDGWMYGTSLTGSTEQCVKTIRRYRDAGADEICLYGSTAAENTNVVRAWREHALLCEGGAGQRVHACDPSLDLLGRVAVDEATRVRVRRAWRAALRLPLGPAAR